MTERAPDDAAPSSGGSRDVGEGGALRAAHDDVAAQGKVNTSLSRSLIGLALLRRLQPPAPPEEGLADMTEARAARVIEWAAARPDLPDEIRSIIQPDS